MKFKETAQVFDVDTKTLAILKAEPMLIVEEAADQKKDYADLTNKELIAVLTDKGVDIPANATKAILLELISESEK
jgi:hypothetical protein